MKVLMRHKDHLMLFIVLTVFFMLFIGVASAERFSLRNGIEWGQSQDTVISRINSESGADKYRLQNYFLVDLLEDYGMSIPEQWIYEAEYHQLWSTDVYGTSFGNDDIQITLSLNGTKKDGLISAFYSMRKDDDSSGSVLYDEAQRLLKQLEKKYGKFTKDIDQWKNRTNAASGAIVWQYSIMIEDGTVIMVYIHKSPYDIFIEYQSPDLKEIEKAISDGSYYIEPSFGL